MPNWIEDEMDTYDDDDAAYDADREDFEQAVQDLLEKWWSEEREAEILSRAEEEHPHLTRLIAALQERKERFFEEQRSDAEYAVADAKEYDRDVYGYYGVRRSDFY